MDSNALNIIEIPGFSDPVSSMTHLFSAGIFLIIGIFLIWTRRHKTSHMISIIIFVFSVVFLLSMSGVFHLLSHDTTGRAVLQRLDHAGIFVLIAGTFTPIHTIDFRGFARWGILLLVWSCAITGLTLKTIFFDGVAEWLGLTFYLSLGWFGLVTAYLLYRRHGLQYIKPMIWGAVFYTFGATLEFLRWPVLIDNVVGPHELFHICVLFGIAAHWYFVARISKQPATV